ncbi:uncharacterized protein NFIA_099490 [Aspergillus fischeri NRRL 181]|uniref:Alpha/beta hydrolase fold-3 domain-containing protein n=1 Tax=Neosartorya fischeri (strain ATCC 1020 / DSM 3700 / CBS 544.65 / FGSC A1164 / JCM 1740 / NRRL 181 / WB 181) TaxID=331117 RepID=A1DBS4_NEOFI|nr:conserved hypothetical protein [Aspergillus fischeri NRRL 181]EAW20314.1 conserved hypothetical protein [Aspergillus fischeri NRRL 181]
MGSIGTHEKLSGFNLIQRHYKQIRDHAIRADFIIPKSTFTGKRPVIVRFHGGGLITGDSLLMEWFPTWLLQLAKKHNAVIVSPNYRLLPESTSPEIFSDIEDFWTWLHSSAVAELLATCSTPTQLDLDRILTAGDSAGGLLSICVGLAHADEIRATTATYPCIDMASEYFRTPTSSEPLPDVPASTVDDYLAQMDRSAIRSSALLPDRFDLMVAAIYYGGLGQFYEYGAEDSPREPRYPLEWLDRPGVKIPRGGIAILHGLQDALVPVQQSEKFVAKARGVMKGKPGGDRIVLTLREGDQEWSIFDIVNVRGRGIFDITEDDRIDEYTSEPPLREDDVTHLLYTPLPTDLPTMNKDLLILMAAYYGNIEWYARLRRPNTWIVGELSCVVRGIYHNTMFAKWWTLQPGREPYQIEQAINARFIMNNDLSRITPETRCLPYCIWYPSFPHVTTCKELVRRVPSMKPAVARVCILQDYSEYWDELDADPDSNLMVDARQSSNPKYLRDLEARIPERGCRDLTNRQHYCIRPRAALFEYTTTFLYHNVWDNPDVYCEAGVPYNGRFACMAHIELSVCVSDELKKIALEDIRETGGPFCLEEYYDSLGENRHSTGSNES